MQSSYNIILFHDAINYKKYTRTASTNTTKSGLIDKFNSMFIYILDYVVPTDTDTVCVPNNFQVKWFWQGSYYWPTWQRSTDTKLPNSKGKYQKIQLGNPQFIKNTFFTINFA